MAGVAPASWTFPGKEAPRSSQSPSSLPEGLPQSHQDHLGPHSLCYAMCQWFLFKWVLSCSCPDFLSPASCARAHTHTQFIKVMNSAFILFVFLCFCYFEWGTPCSAQGLLCCGTHSQRYWVRIRQKGEARRDSRLYPVLTFALFVCLFALESHLTDLRG